MTCAGKTAVPSEVEHDAPRVGPKRMPGKIFVEGADFGNPADVALRDRRMLSGDGIFVVVATISEQDGASVAEPEIILRGVPYPDDASQLLGDLRRAVDASLQQAARDHVREIDELQKLLHDDLAKLVYDRLRQIGRAS